jgi:preprotein translocase subunit SecA
MYGRRYNNGLHQAIEAKEGVKIADESKTLATITFQNYFRMYEKLSGMTGTAMTEEAEFQEIYHLDVIEIPTNRPMIREDHNDIIYKNERAKFKAVIEDIKESNAKGQPVLVGTVSIEKSEKLSALLKKEGIKHEVLNAKFHEKEAEIVAQAGKYGAVTIATNMAGRGTDIMLGGNSEYLAKQEMRKLKYSDELIEQATAFNETSDEEILNARKKFKELEDKFNEQIKEEKEKVIAAGGLKIIGTERHESRRIDNQLRGRSGRQGDNGESRFYIGLDDDLMKIFGGDKITTVYNMIGADEDIPITTRMISKSVENAQKRVEGRNFSIRKNVLNYDDVMNVQRELIYAQRREVLDGENLKDKVVKMMDSVAEDLVAVYMSEDPVNKEAFEEDVRTTFGIGNVDALKADKLNEKAIVEEIINKVHSNYEAKETEFGEEQLRELERVVMLKIVDQRWMDHIDAMDELKEGIGLQGYGQKDPVVQYRLLGGEMFDEMSANIKVDVVRFLLNSRKREGTVSREESARVTDASLADTAIRLVDGTTPEKDANTPVVNTEPKIGRNDPCPCGSGLKYKNCCGKS